MKSSVRPIGLVLGLLLAGAASAAESQYLILKGQKSGAIKGSVTVKGLEGAIQVDSIFHEILSPRDAASGLPTGQRQHKPFVVNVPVDKAWALLYSVMVTNENLTTVQLRVLAPSTNASGAGTGALASQRVVTLTNANIADIKEYTVDGTNGKPAHNELQISFTYQKIEWTWTDGGITAYDDWEARN